MFKLQLSRTMNNDKTLNTVGRTSGCVGSSLQAAHCLPCVFNILLCNITFYPAQSVVTLVSFCSLSLPKESKLVVVKCHIMSNRTGTSMLSCPKCSVLGQHYFATSKWCVVLEFPRGRDISLRLCVV